jgi:hypothetical protein
LDLNMSIRREHLKGKVMLATTRSPCKRRLMLTLLLGSMASPAAAREEIAVLDGGYAVGVSDGFIVTGDPYADVTRTIDAGRVIPYRPVAGGGWTRSPDITASHKSDFDKFGAAIAIDGLVLVVGAPADDVDLPHEGAAYIYRRQGVVWVEEDYLVSGFNQPLDDFGISVAVDEELVAVGDSTFDTVFVYRYEQGTWVEEAQLTPSGALTNTFGESVSLSGD